MRILWIQENASFVGGCEYYIFNTVRLLKERGIKASLLYDPLRKTDPEFLSVFDQAFPLVTLERQLHAIPHDLVFVHQLTRDEPFKILNLAASAPVVRFFHDHWLFCLRRSKISLFSNEPCLVPAQECCAPLHASLVRDDHWPCFKLLTLSRLRSSQELNKHLDGFVVPSEYMAHQVAANGFDASKIETIPLYAPEPRETSLSQAQRETNLLLFVGQLVRGKGLDVLLKALTMAVGSYRLLVVGEGKLRPFYEKMAKKSGIENKVAFLGKVKQKELELWYQRAACVVFPVRIPETFALVGPEAMRFGTPVIASNLGGVAEWLEPDKTGLMVPYNDPQALAAAIDKLCQTPGLAALMGENARKSYQEKFRPEIHLSKLLDYLQRKIKEKESQRLNRWGRFTVLGSPALEKTAAEVVFAIDSAMRTNFPSNYFRAVLLIGGYGKGEGGVEKMGGVEHLHNNLDLFLITQGLGPEKQEKLKKRLHGLFRPVEERYGVAIDFSLMDHCKLQRSSTLLIWYDMYHGHKLISGDKDYVASLPFNDEKTIPSSEILALMVNRGTLLIINDWLIGKGLQAIEHKKMVVRHLMKAIIGFGDAFLYFLGRYHWSYREKQDRISKSGEVSASFRSLYEQAALFRFEADYEPYLTRDLVQWNHEIRKALGEIFLICASYLMKGKTIDSANFFDAFLDYTLLNDLYSRESIKQKAKGLMAPPKQSLGKTLTSRLAFRLLSPKQRLLLPFAFLAFGIGGSEMQGRIYRYLESASSGQAREAYLREWSLNNDRSFLKILDKR